MKHHFCYLNQLKCFPACRTWAHFWATSSCLLCGRFILHFSQSVWSPIFSVSGLTIHPVIYFSKSLHEGHRQQRQVNPWKLMEMADPTCESSLTLPQMKCAHVSCFFLRCQLVQATAETKHIKTRAVATATATATTATTTTMTTTTIHDREHDDHDNDRYGRNCRDHDLDEGTTTTTTTTTKKKKKKKKTKTTKTTMHKSVCASVRVCPGSHQ